MRLKGKRALVTAGGQGIGRAIAEAFIEEGAAVCALDINAAALETLVGGLGVVVDATDAASVQALPDRIGGVDILVNAAGFVHPGTILDCDEAAWRRSLDLNMTAMYRLCRAFLPDMLAVGGGSIINVASVASSIKGVPNRFAYGATKAGVIGLSKAIAADFVVQGVRCNAICPGTIDTPSLRERVREDAARRSVPFETAMAEFEARQAVGRLGKVQEVAALAVHLASDESAFTTGAVHVIDGGWIN